MGPLLLNKECYEAHKRDLGGDKLYFTYADYLNFETNHYSGAIYEMKNKDGSKVMCKVAYYPLPYYRDLRALIEIDMGHYNDFRDVPVRFLTITLNHEH